MLRMLVAVCAVILLSSTEASALSAPQILESGRPFLLYGTAWKKSNTARLVYEAIHAGFRFVDTACQPRHYFEPGVGEGWLKAAQELGLSRSDLFLQTKFTSLDGQDPENVPYEKSAPLEEQVRQSLDVSLSNLHTTYLDSLVMHSPMSTHEDTIRVWRVFESFVDDGRVKNLGVSNCYDLGEFSRIYDEARIKPKVLQNRFYDDSGFDVELRNFCAQNGVKYQSFWTLSANRNALATPEIREIASSKGLTPQTLMYAFMMRLGHTPLDGTTDPGHMEEDVAVMGRFQEGDNVFGSDDEVRRMAEILGMPELDKLPNLGSSPDL